MWREPINDGVGSLKGLGAMSDTMPTQHGNLGNLIRSIAWRSQRVFPNVARTSDRQLNRRQYDCDLPAKFSRPVCQRGYAGDRQTLTLGSVRRRVGVGAQAFQTGNDASPNRNIRSRNRSRYKYTTGVVYRVNSWLKIRPPTIAMPSGWRSSAP